MTKDEFVEKYGNVVVRFSHYYKYTFTYEGVTDDGKRLTCRYGGNSDEIYRHEVSSNGHETVGLLYPYAGSVIVDGKEIEGFYDY